MRKLVLIRHGESTWNLENRFTGWTDVGLTPNGVEQAKQAGQLLNEANIRFDTAYTSVLKRAIHTLWNVLDTMDCPWLPTQCDWRLNERHYGALQGLDKSETAKKYGDEQVHIWRRSYDTPPPAMEENDPRSERGDIRYASLRPEQIPLTECLQDTVKRVMPCWNECIAPSLKAEKAVLLVAHGNSIRALIKHLDTVSNQDIVGVNVPNGVPLVYELDEHLKPLNKYYLGDAKKIEAACKAVEQQGKA